MIGDAHQLVAAQILHEDIGAAVLGQHHGQHVAVGRKHRRTVDAGIIGDLAALAGGDILGVDARQIGLEGNVGDFVGVRRPVRRHDGFLGAQQHLGPATVVIGFFEPETGVGAARLFGDHIEDLRGEGAADAGYLFIHDIADFMADVAQLRDAAAEHFAGEQQFAVDVEKLVLDLHQLAAGRAAHLAHEQIVLGHHLPVAEKDLALLARHAEQVFPFEGAELAHLFEIVGDDPGDVFGAETDAAGLKRHHGDGDRVIDALGDLDAELRVGGGVGGQQDNRKQEAMGFQFNKSSG